MKLLYTLILFSVWNFSINAQISHDLEIFADDGVVFTLELNGEMINTEAKNRIFIENTDHDYISVRIKIPNEEGLAIDRTIPIVFPSSYNEKSPVTAVYKLKKKKKKYKLHLISRSYKKIQVDREVRVINEQIVRDGDRRRRRR